PVLGLGLVVAIGPGSAVARGHHLRLLARATPGVGQTRGSASISGAPGAARGVPPLDANATASFAKLRARLKPDARIAIAIEPFGAGRMESLGGDPGMQAMSTSKVLILSA